jgi:hypothetical protein
VPVRAARSVWPHLQLQASGQVGHRIAQRSGDHVTMRQRKRRRVLAIHRHRQPRQSSARAVRAGVAQSSGDDGIHQLVGEQAIGQRFSQQIARPDGCRVRFPAARSAAASAVPSATLPPTSSSITTCRACEARLLPAVRPASSGLKTPGRNSCWRPRVGNIAVASVATATAGQTRPTGGIGRVARKAHHHRAGASTDRRRTRFRPETRHCSPSRFHRFYRFPSGPGGKNCLGRVHGAPY